MPFLAASVCATRLELAAAYCVTPSAREALRIDAITDQRT
jgi:hypothetical protein